MNGEEEFRERVDVALDKILQEIAFIKADTVFLNKKRERDNEEFRKMFAELRDEYRDIVVQLRTDITLALSEISGRLGRTTSNLETVKKNRQTIGGVSTSDRQRSGH